MKLLLGILAATVALHAQTFTIEADPDFYFDRGITLAAGIKPSAASRWTFLGDFASRKIGPVDDRERLRWRIGGMTRFRLFGERNSLFAQFGAAYANVRTKDGAIHTGASVRPGIGVQWFPWREKGFYFAPQLGIENYPGRTTLDKRLEIRIGWQF